MSEQPLSPAHPWALDASQPSSGSPVQKSGRSAKRLLRRLAASTGWLEPVHGSGGEPVRFHFVALNEERGKRHPSLDRRTVETWRSRGWVAPTSSGMFKLTAAGYAVAASGQTATKGDPVSPFRRQHGSIGDETRIIDGTSRQVTADAAESPLGWLARRRDRHGRPLIEETEFVAGERLRADFTIAGLSQRVTASWEQSIASGSSGRSGSADVNLMMSERAMDARRRVNRALAMVGPGLAGILLEVCCLTSGLEAAERRLGLPQRAGKVVLQIALSRLAEHYGLATQVPGKAAAVRIRSWGSQTYRPTLFGLDRE